MRDSEKILSSFIPGNKVNITEFMCQENFWKDVNIKTSIDQLHTIYYQYIKTQGHLYGCDPKIHINQEKKRVVIYWASGDGGFGAAIDFRASSSSTPSLLGKIYTNTSFAEERPEKFVNFSKQIIRE